MNEFSPEELKVTSGSGYPDAGEGAGTDNRVIGFYQVQAVLGRGGMGEVLKALDTRNGRTVALKLVDVATNADPETLKRFEREARAAADLDHPNIARMYGLEYDEEKRPFIVMEYVQGVSLEAMGNARDDLPFSTLCDYMIQVAKGLEAAFRKSIIHRDIKPGNLLVTPGGIVKIIDFGLAKSIFDKTFLTATGMVVGTPRYISPEQALARSVDHRSDIYSLGATFYELVTRQCPFDGDSAMSIMMKHVNTPLMAPYLINPQVPGDVSEIIMRMMAKDPGERYQNYEGLIRNLEAAKLHRLAKEQRRQLHAHGEPTAGATSDGQKPSSYLTEGFVNVSVAEMPDGETPAPKAKLVLLGLVGLVILLIAGGSFLQAQHASERGEPSWVARAIVGAFGRKGDTKPLTPDELVALDTERVNATKRRMESTLNKIIDYRRNMEDRAATLTVRDLRAKNVLTTEETKDEWGNDFLISSANGGQLVAPGRDGQEGTRDDFRYTLTGIVIAAPQPISYDDAVLILDKEKAEAEKK